MCSIGGAVGLGLKPLPNPSSGRLLDIIANLRTTWENFKKIFAAFEPMYYTSNYPNLTVLAGIIGSSSATVYVNTSVSIPATLDFAAIAPNVSLHVLQGGSFNIASGQTLTIPIPETGAYRIFYGDGVVRFSNGTGRDLFVQNWGAKADNTNGTQTDNAAAFQAALNATKAGFRVLVPNGEYGFLSGISLYERNHLVGTRMTRLWFYGSTIASPYTAVFLDGGTDGTSGDFNGGIENLELLQAGEEASGTGLYLSGSIPAEFAHNLQRIIFRDITIRKFEKALHFENVAYINAFYNVRSVGCRIGVYAKNAVNAVNFYGFYYDGKGISGVALANSYGVQYISDNNPTYYTLALNFTGGSIENVEHALYTDQNVTFTSQFFGMYFEGGDIDLLSGHVVMVGCNTRHSAENHHIILGGSAALELYGHTFGGSLNGVDPTAALVKLSGGASYIEHGRTLHSAMLGLTGRTNPKIGITGANVTARYWGIDPATGGEEGLVREFGASMRYRDNANEDSFLAYNLANALVSSMSSEKVTSPTFERSVEDIYTATLHLFRADTSDGTDNKRVALCGGGGAGTNQGGKFIAAGNESSGTGKVTMQPGDVAGAIAEILVRDNQALALSINQAGDNYIGVDTTNAAEAIKFGNASQNPVYTFQGTGLLSSGGNIGATTLGRGLQVKAGTNGRINMGNVLVAGTVTVANTSVTANTMISWNRVVSGGTLGEITITRNAGVGYTITSSNATETSTIDVMLTEAT